MISNPLQGILLSTILVIPFFLQGQQAPKVKLFEEGNVSNSFLDGKIVRQELSPHAVYFDSKWHKGKIVMKDGSAQAGIYLRYDLLHSNVEVREKASVITHPIRHIKSFSWYNFYTADSIQFVSLSDIKDQRYNDFEAIYETVLAGGPINLLAITKAFVLKPNYLPALDLGDPENSVIRRKTYFLYDGERLIPINKKLKRNLMAFKPYEKEVYLFAKEHKLKCKREKDLRVMIMYLNRLASTGSEELPDLLNAFQSKSFTDLQ